MDNKILLYRSCCVVCLDDAEASSLKRTVEDLELANQEKSRVGIKTESQGLGYTQAKFRQGVPSRIPLAWK